MFKYMFTIIVIFMFTGCCVSLFDDTCVIERDVPGPTKFVHEKCEFESTPDKPVWVGDPIRFKEISFDDKVYYGITENEAITLDINLINNRAYTNTLRAIIMKYQPKKEEESK